MISKAMYVEYLRGYAREGKAVALAESVEDPYALSPGGLGCGLMQQSAKWQETFPPLMEALANSFLFQHAMATDHRWHPAYQLACYATFCYKGRLLDLATRLRLYHYGHEQPEDPDDYVARVMREWGELASW